MGGQVIAQCPCGLRVAVLIGSGAADYATCCYGPALCERCRAVVQINVLETEPRCPQCGAAAPIPYDDPALCGAPGDVIVASWDAVGEGGWVVTLSDGQYLCPACGQATLTFADGGLLWD